MIKKQCPNKDCNSRNTYAVPSKAIVKTDEGGKVELDEMGVPVKTMCRRCRNCGQYYYDDGKFIPKIPKDGPMADVIKKLQSDRGIEVK
jgi:hypothetical protein